ncbi:MAG: hypothetical protein H6698_03780 [Myxococcales bacterium]|nr:hypothetical protein [Myxococcales bacterium]MCB9533434.1 hypothetical protein [Myxococcales bacterium]
MRLPHIPGLGGPTPAAAAGSGARTMVGVRLPFEPTEPTEPPPSADFGGTRTTFGIHVLDEDLPPDPHTPAPAASESVPRAGAIDVPRGSALGAGTVVGVRPASATVRGLLVDAPDPSSTAVSSGSSASSGASATSLGLRSPPTEAVDANATMIGLGGSSELDASDFSAAGVGATLTDDWIDDIASFIDEKVGSDLPPLDQSASAPPFAASSDSASGARSASESDVPAAGFGIVRRTRARRVAASPASVVETAGSADHRASAERAVRRERVELVAPVEVPPEPAPAPEPVAPAISAPAIARLEAPAPEPPPKRALAETALMEFDPAVLKGGGSPSDSLELLVDIPSERAVPRNALSPIAVQRAADPLAPLSPSGSFGVAAAPRAPAPATSTPLPGGGTWHGTDASSGAFAATIAMASVPDFGPPDAGAPDTPSATSATLPGGVGAGARPAALTPPDPSAAASELASAHDFVIPANLPAPEPPTARPGTFPDFSRHVPTRPASRSEDRSGLIARRPASRSDDRSGLIARRPPGDDDLFSVAHQSGVRGLPQRGSGRGGALTKVGGNLPRILAVAVLVIVLAAIAYAIVRAA